MHFNRTTDYELVRRILTRRRMYEWMGDDYAPPVEQFQVNTDPRIWYVLASDEWRAIGLFCFFPENEICWAAHVALLRGTHPRLTHRAGWEVVRWLWNNTPCLRLTAKVPACNRAAVRFGLGPMGLKLIGPTLEQSVEPLSFMKGGRLVDQILMGRSRP
jgi:hypothetical protein